MKKLSKVPAPFCSAPSLIGSLLNIRFQPFHPNCNSLRRSRRDYAVAAAHGNTQGPLIQREAIVTFLQSEAEPWRFDYFTVCATLSVLPDRRGSVTAPRGARSSSHLGQDPYMDFPPRTSPGSRHNEGKPLKVLVKYLGLLGPQGALPLATTEEAYHYLLAQDDAFPRFLDIFNNRFIQLFFRAWADSRPIAQHDRPAADRFVDYIGSTIGVGSRPYRDLDSVPDASKLSSPGFLARRQNALRGSQRYSRPVQRRAEVEEFIGSRLQHRSGRMDHS